MPSTPSPTATYRLQLRREFGFREAAAVVPYLAALGVSHVYCSPVLQAVPGSAHGYDVVDHSRLSSDLGGEAGWAQLVAACRSHRLGQIGRASCRGRAESGEERRTWVRCKTEAGDG